MISFIFASDANFSDAECYDDLSKNFEDINNIVLEDKNELEILLRLIGLSLPDPLIISGEFGNRYDMSGQVMQEISLDGFDDFYANWIELTGRENTMDEYGQLAFLIEKTEAWNKCLSRYILQEKS
ncbi:MAG: hypothetical protein E6Q34_09010 [Burkholderiaceae bacterium]|nr:MAG: hypothetical protein E6Q34_09010 [Burkholderiaceae bacterium]